MIQTSRYKCAFSYYGGKSKLAHLYPEPIGRKIIEPFAGAAAYSVRYADRDVWINDLDPGIAAIWSFLTSPDALRIVRDMIPENVDAGATIDSIVPPDAPMGLVELLRAEAGQGSYGMRSTRLTVSPFGAKCWPRLRPRLKWLIPRIAHWQVTNLDYRQLPTGDDETTWFIDPPYANAAGVRYRQQPGSFAELAQWIKTRQGARIVCENSGADWLPFAPLTAARWGIKNGRDSSNAGEAIWIDGFETVERRIAA